MDLHDRLRVTTEDDGDEVVIVLAGEVDPHTCPQLRAVLADAVAGAPSRIVVDTQNIEFVDSSGLRALLQAQQAQAARQATLELRSPSPIMRRLLRVTALESTFCC
jgi:anti-sigma B factor antagonist